MKKLIFILLLFTLALFSCDNKEQPEDPKEDEPVQKETKTYQFNVHADVEEVDISNYDVLPTSVKVDDPVRMYLKEIGKIPLLTLEQEKLYSEQVVVGRKAREQLEKIELAIAKKIGHKVELKNLIDSRLIGGVRVVIHDHVYDGSIKYKLETLQNNLKERRTN